MRCINVHYILNEVEKLIEITLLIFVQNIEVEFKLKSLAESLNETMTQTIGHVFLI